MVSLFINVVIAVGSVLAWLSIMFGRGSELELALRGIKSLKYYTVLSNLFSAIACAIYALCFLVPARTPEPWILGLKLASTTTVMITFLTTALLLAPVYGWHSMYKKGNFWLHLVLPLLALVDVCLFVPIRTLSPWFALGAVAFTAAYAVGYLRPVLKYGAEKDGKVYDFYGFLRWGENGVWVVAAGMLLASAGISLLLCLANGVLSVG